MAWSRRDLLRASLGAIVVACGGTATPAATGADGRPNDPLAANGSLGVWPDRIAKAPKETQDAYAYAAQRPRSLQYIPCFCGCVQSGHKNNLDCYVKSFMDKGWVVLDLHGYG